MQKSYLGLRSNRRARSEDKDRAGPALDGRLADGGEAADGGGGGGQVQSEEDPGEWALIPASPGLGPGQDAFTPSQIDPGLRVDGDLQLSHNAEVNLLLGGLQHHARLASKNYRGRLKLSML